MKKLAGILVAIFILSAGAFAQEKAGLEDPGSENLKVPSDWTVRFDQPNPDIVIGDDPETADLYFVNMEPGWHVTTGPRAIFYNPDNVAEGEFKIRAKLHLFDTKGRDREGYGIFFGGTDLDADSQKYIYFLLRNTGEFLVKYRDGSETKVIKDWTASDAIAKYQAGTDATAENNLMVSIMGGNMVLSINSKVVATVSADGWVTDGVYGLRVNHAVNLHVEELVSEPGLKTVME